MVRHTRIFPMVVSLALALLVVGCPPGGTTAKQPFKASIINATDQSATVFFNTSLLNPTNDLNDKVLVVPAQTVTEARIGKDGLDALGNADLAVSVSVPNVTVLNADQAIADPALDVTKAILIYPQSETIVRVQLLAVTPE